MFGNTVMDVTMDGEKPRLTRREVVRNKLFAAAMSGKVTALVQLEKMWADMDAERAKAEARIAAMERFYRENPEKEVTFEERLWKVQVEAALHPGRSG